MVHDGLQVTDKALGIGKACNPPGIVRRLFHGDRAGDGGVELLVVEDKGDRIVMAPVGGIEVPSRNRNGKAGAFQGVAETGGDGVVLLVIGVSRQGPGNIQVGCGDEGRTQGRMDDAQDQGLIFTGRLMQDKSIKN